MPFPIDKQFIEETEKRLGVIFPPIFKAKMIQMNGGELFTEDDDWNLYPFLDKSSTKRISRTCNHIELETKDALEWENFPRNGIPIANNGCGDQLILLPSHKGSINLGDAIYLWRHEEEAPTLVAPNINILIDISTKAL